jgi:hypothetical protein
MTRRRRSLGVAVAVTGWVVGIAFVAYGLLGVGVKLGAQVSHGLIFARGSDPYDQMYLLALPVCAVMGVSIIRNLHRLGRVVRGVANVARDAGPRALAGRLLLGVGAVWAAFTTLCVMVLPTTSELNPEFPQLGPVVLPIPDSLHGYLVPWRLPESWPWRLGVAVALLALTVAAGLIVLYGRGTATSAEG